MKKTSKAHSRQSFDHHASTEGPGWPTMEPNIVLLVLVEGLLAKRPPFPGIFYKILQKNAYIIWEYVSFCVCFFVPVSLLCQKQQKPTKKDNYRGNNHIHIMRGNEIVSSPIP